MAGMGKRMRPHTLITPKPLIPVGGKPIVQRLVEDIASICEEPIDEIAFIIGDFGTEVESELLAIAERLGSRGQIYYQKEALGTGHAIYCAEPALNGPVVVAFADTLFKADFKLDASKDGIIWVQKVNDPSQFGVVKVNTEGEITELVEKPATYVSDLAIIGIYFFRDGAALRNEMQFLIDNNIKEKGEFQFTSALVAMQKKGARFSPGQVQEWLDCGNKDVLVQTNSRYLEFIKDQKLISDKAKIVNSVIIPPCYVGDNVVVENCVVGPYVSVGESSTLRDSRISQSIIQRNTGITNAVLYNSVLGNFVNFEGKSDDVNLGDYSAFVK